MIHRILTYNGKVLKYTDLPIQTNIAAIDTDGNYYNSVIIRDQEWLIENLKTTKYKDKTSIPNLVDKIIYAGTSSEGYILQSANKGLSWSILATSSYGNPTCFHKNTINNHILYGTDTGYVVDYTAQTQYAVSSYEITAFGQIGESWLTVSDSNGSVYYYFQLTDSFVSPGPISGNPKINSIISILKSNQALFILNGADNITIDGRINRAGTDAVLTFENMDSSITMFLNSPEQSTIVYTNKLEGSVGWAPLTGSETYTIGSGGDFSTVKAAFDYINAGSASGDIVLKIIGNLSESAASTLQSPGGGNYSSIVIYPTVECTVSGNIDGTLITLDQTTNVTIDGRINRLGSTKSLTFQNNSTHVDAETIEFTNTPTQTSVIYCNGIDEALVQWSPLAGVTTYTVGKNSIEFINLKDAFDYLNLGAASGDIVLQINGNCYESQSAILNDSGGGINYTSVTIYPIGNYSIFGNSNIFFTKTGIYLGDGVFNPDFILLQNGNFKCSYNSGNGIFYAGDSSDHIWKSTDYGSTWSDLGAVSYDVDPSGINFIVKSQNRFIYGYTKIGYSDNDFSSFTLTSVGINPISCVVYDTNILICGDSSGHIYRSIDNGTNWTDIGKQQSQESINALLLIDTSISSAWSLDSSGAYCWYDDNENYKNTYGALYNWYAVNNTRDLAPEGWKIPSRADFNLLISYLDGSLVAGGKLKEVGTDHWDYPNTGATDSFGFKSLPAGYRDASGNFSNLFTNSYYWTSTSDGISSFVYYDSYNNTFLENSTGFSKNDGLSVRCMRYIGVPEVSIGTQIWSKFNYDKNANRYPYNHSIYKDDYGGLYNWQEAMSINEPGWHLPSVSEYNILMAYVGYGTNMKESGTVHWISSSSVSDNYGFSALGAGKMSGSTQSSFKENACLWTSSIFSSQYSYAIRLDYNNNTVATEAVETSTYRSVRLIKNS